MSVGETPEAFFEPDRQELAEPEQAAFARLRPREREVLKLLATGATNAEIARSLQLAEGTIRNVVARLTIKLGVADRTQAALLAARAGLLPERNIRLASVDDPQASA